MTWLDVLCWWLFFGAAWAFAEIVLWAMEPINKAYRMAVRRIIDAYARGDEERGQALVADTARRFWRGRRSVMWDIEDVAVFGKPLGSLGAGPF